MQQNNQHKGIYERYTVLYMRITTIQTFIKYLVLIFYSMQVTFPVKT